ncbi:MAG: acetyl-CoA carboxylase carboxyl transferase subunit beta [Flavobacteriales bacterium CG_4_10_14_0_2_um_filter_32_8]|nr:MAG: acetyl-CoA carboxylase carboxyl transferase subunit beta [Flavobacteriales bacterium CG_4_10_14_0_2_um_filter_32_8]PJB15497.1 MAG: acetyl-CoA carboxylase carboxyl transferase subunit beta [Flavobacteriales bacterium CG_4_9_14_3_um_filter_32_8]
MVWFKRRKQGVVTPTNEKKETPEGLWYKCPKCKHVVTHEEDVTNLYICSVCSYHEKIDSLAYFKILFDHNKYKELNPNLTSGDPLNFEDTKKYVDRLKDTEAKTHLKDAIRTAVGKIEKQDVVIACMDFNFIGGSMGSVVGEKIARAIDYSIKKKIPLLIISKSGGARMMEAAYSLMQMAKTAAKLSQLAKEKLPYISLLTDPTTGGVTASFAMLGDINIAEPEALIAFAGPRVVKETIGKDLPVGFQTSEFVLEHGFLDYIVPRNELKKKIALSIKLFNN